MVKRDLTEELLEAAKEYPVVTVFGPRQSGKTTLGQMTFPDKYYRSLEDPNGEKQLQFKGVRILNLFSHGVPDGCAADQGEWRHG
jgi:predicted AAA+ superfamily ATPase